MKQIFRILCCIILLPLLAAPSQAAFAPELDCVHCREQQADMPDCCVVMDRSTIGMDGVEAALDKRACPHAGFCQGEAGPAARLLLNSVQLEAATQAVD